MDNEKENVMSFNIVKIRILMLSIFRFVGMAFALLAAAMTISNWRTVCAAESDSSPPKVDFSYAFATPHGITIGRPDASDRTPESAR